MAPWLLYRLRLGGESYGANFADFLPADLADLAPRVLAAATRLAAGGPSSFLAPQTAGPAPAPWAVLGVALAFVGVYGAWRWWRDPAPGESPLPVLALAATGALTALWTVAFVHLEPALPTRLLLPVAPLLWIAVARGGRALLLDAVPGGGPVPPSGAAAAPRHTVPRAAAAAAVALAVAATAADVAFHPRPPAAERAAIARDHLAFFEAVRREVPPDGRVMSRYHQMVWLYTGRRGHSFPAELVDGRLAALPPFGLLLALEHWRVGWIVATPAPWAGLEDGSGAVGPFAHAYPAVVRRRAGSADGRYALLRLVPGPFEALCRRLRVREINARFEAQEGHR
jgi:hypothetical protein